MMATDALAVVVPLRDLGSPNRADKFIRWANETYFEPTSGAYLAIPAVHPPGIAARVPASGDTPSAEVLALLAGVDAKTADLIRRNLMHQIEYDELPPGDILLGLSQGQK
jgi:hypothetical protein